MSEWKQVTKEECEAYLKQYGKPLDWNVTMICDPPMGNWNDFSEGKVWPESMVAKVVLEEGDTRMPTRTQNTYYLRSEAGKGGAE